MLIDKQANNLACAMHKAEKLQNKISYLRIGITDLAEELNEISDKLNEFQGFAEDLLEKPEPPREEVTNIDP